MVGIHIDKAEVESMNDVIGRTPGILSLTYNIYDTIEVVRKRPGMYLGTFGRDPITIYHMSVFLAGFDFAMYGIGAIDVGEPEFHGFHEWIKRKFGYGESTAGWSNMILAQALGLPPITSGSNLSWEGFNVHVSPEQHERALAMFFGLLDEYRASVNRELRHRLTVGNQISSSDGPMRGASESET